MSRLLDADTDVLEVLDFVPSCGFPEGEQHPAEAAIVCRTCRTVQLLCNAHVHWLRARMERKPRRVRVITCTACGAQGDAFDKVAEVVPL